MAGTQKKDIIKSALLEAKELERASMEAATSLIVENFSPNLTDFFKDVLKEEHDLGKEPDFGREDTDASGDELDEEEKKDDVSGDATPEKGQSAQPIKPTVKTGMWEEDEDEEDVLPSDEETPPPPSGEEGGEGGDDFEIPDELFDDEDDMKEEDDEFGDEDLDLGDDDEIDLDIEDDDLPPSGDGDEDEDDLPFKQEGRISSLRLRKENRRLKKLVESLTTQMRDINLFNSKLAHLNKLYMSGMYTNKEKEKIAERLDKCGSLKSVGLVYKKIIAETKGAPSKNFANLIKEARTKGAKEAKNDSLYRSPELAKELNRFKTLAGLGNK